LLQIVTAYPLHAIRRKLKYLHVVVIIDPPECGYGFSLNGLRVGTHVPYVMVYGNLNYNDN
jgi:hypothetical protein